MPQTNGRNGNGKVDSIDYFSNLLEKRKKGNDIYYVVNGYEESSFSELKRLILDEYKSSRLPQSDQLDNHLSEFYLLSKSQKNGSENHIGKVILKINKELSEIELWLKKLWSLQQPQPSRP